MGDYQHITAARNISYPVTVVQAFTRISKSEKPEPDSEDRKEEPTKDEKSDSLQPEE